MENKVEQQEQVQKQLEGKETNFFFNHVKDRVKKLHENGELLKTLETIIGKLKQTFTIPFDKNEYEVVGIISFVVGMDYCGQAFFNKKVIENVNKRFMELEITEDEYQAFLLILTKLKDKNISEYITIPRDEMKEKITKKLSYPAEEKLMYKNLKAKLNGFLDVALIPIGFAVGLSDLRKEELTYENVLKINSLLQENATFSGNDIEKLTSCYGDPLFNKVLQKSLNVLNESKYAILYEESLTSAVEAIMRLGNLIINPEFFTDAQYEEFAENFKLKAEKKEEEKEEEVFDELFTQGDVETMMVERPDQFIITSLKDISKKNITDNKSVVDAIESVLKNEDYMQHLYMYMGQNIKNPKRVVGMSYLPETVDTKVLVEALNEVIKIDGVEYKRLAEINCAEIPDDQVNRVVTYVNDCIKSCQLRTPQQKQYLVSQLVENQITTWNHLQQILSILETCEIKGRDCLTYVNLTNYIQDKSNITEVFDNGEKLTKLELHMSLYRAFREWFKFHLPVETPTETEKQ